MPQTKFTMTQGQTDVGAVQPEAGDAEASSETISINIDATNLTKGEALVMIEKITETIHRGEWPPVVA
ncbi:hypothetical protein [Croceicoccus mobilis]|uniref:Uncharacterized protein n=1 Tax=Croceicoccus mobilis TaxID=1703339 RepID=A0A916Z322_9SPHN|nr:hypothetical protein [Croceicoccus mobilis]GGD73907.1 hypothetical protein GCM10010990_24410 [Croceicoccus mobilis]